MGSPIPVPDLSTRVSRALAKVSVIESIGSQQRKDIHLRWQPDAVSGV